MHPLHHARLALMACCALFSTTFVITRAADPKSPAAANITATSPVQPAPESPPVLFIDFQQKISGVFTYSSWQDRLAVSPSGLLVQGSKGAQGNGGLGRTLTPALDLSAETFVEIAIGVGALNEVPEVTIAFNDADKTQCATRVRIDQLMPQQPVWLRVRLADFKPVKGQEGADGKMDWPQVGQWHLQGDWTTKKPFHVMFIALRTRR